MPGHRWGIPSLSPVGTHHPAGPRMNGGILALVASEDNQVPLHTTAQPPISYRLRTEGFFLSGEGSGVRRLQFGYNQGDAGSWEECNSRKFLAGRGGMEPPGLGLSIKAPGRRDVLVVSGPHPPVRPRAREPVARFPTLIVPGLSPRVSQLADK